MITYHYQILRFLPDRVNEEFVNLGVVVFDPELNIVKSRFIDKSSRASTFFADINGRYLNATLKFLQLEFEKVSDKTVNELEYKKEKSLDDVTKSILPKDDSSLVFTETRSGLDVNVDVACNELFQRVVLKNLSEHEDLEYRNDKEVWKVYKDYFEKRDIVKHFQQHTVMTKDDSLMFERAYKNGSWNCFETVSFNLIKPESVKNKVYKWVGKLDELKTAKDPIKLYLLSVLPDNIELKAFIERKLNNIELDHSKVQIVTEENVEKLTRLFEKEIATHS